MTLWPRLFDSLTENRPATLIASYVLLTFNRLDLYLARLITSKQILTPYVDQFFNTILLEQLVYAVPPPIKFLFDFLEKHAHESLNKQATMVRLPV